MDGSAARGERVMEVKLVVVGGSHAGMAIPIPGPKFLIGRGESCQFRPQNKLVSRNHCAILVHEDSVTIEDAGSRNGTFVNGEKIQQRELKNGDRVKVGVFELQGGLIDAWRDYFDSQAFFGAPSFGGSEALKPRPYQSSVSR